ncbi:uncharacterized protein LOC110253135 [Exaiptasia diaphana]|uniref:Uncharacterized protein n=1 Tax=Exaiptasia diaphana TaxID=2652724 RepID=A0A913Y5Y4_EXADI|nr:uncharacterized protein LOC110253135 [Exaiptasia diaphana]
MAFCEEPLSTRATRATIKNIKHLNYLLRKILLQRITYGFPYQEEKTGEWFELPQSQFQKVTRTGPINILNIRGTKPKKIENYPLINGTDFLKNLTENGYKILFHGTNHDSAKNIIENGICLDKLNKQRAQDFSCGKGFYLTDQFDEETGAVTWAFRRMGRHQSVLIFKIPNHEFESYRGRSKNLIGKDKELKEFVKMYRLGKEKNRDLQKNLKEVSFVEGPWVKLDRESVSIIQGSYQICLHCDKMAECFDRHLHSVIFFNK